jgi:hypothetical protein
MVAPIPSGEGKMIMVAIPNWELQTVFSRWIRTDFERRVSPELRGRSTSLFNNMVYGSMSLFAHEFWDHVFNSMPSQIFGSQEGMYQAYVYSYLAAAADAIFTTPRWKIEVECPAGAGCLDSIIQGTGERHSVVLELKRIRHDKPEGYRASEAKQLTEETGNAMM